MILATSQPLDSVVIALQSSPPSYMLAFEPRTLFPSSFANPPSGSSATTSAGSSGPALASNHAVEIELYVPHPTPDVSVRPAGLR